MAITSIFLNLKVLAGAADSTGKLSFATSPNFSDPTEVDVSHGPAALLEKVLELIDQPFCILLPQDSHPDAGALSVVLKAMQEGRAELAIAQVEDASGRRSIVPRRLEDLRFSSLLPLGTVIFTREHFARTVAKLPVAAWDAWWHFDLVRLGTSTGLVCLSNEVIAKVKEAAIPARYVENLVPLRRPITSLQPVGEPVILLYGAIEASVSLYFDGLPADLQRQIRFYAPTDPLSDLPHLAAASAIIVVRDFEHMATSGLLGLLSTMDIPLFWFTDDHLESLRPEYPAFRYYDSAAMRDFLSKIRAVLVSTPSLAEIYRKIHHEVILWPLIFDETLARALSSGDDPPSFRVGAFGGSFRRDSLQQDILPAMQKFQGAAPPSLYLRADLAQGIEGDQVVSMPFDSSYRQFVSRWQKLGLHAVVHPFGVTRNIRNKSLGSVLTARYLGAVPVVAAEANQRDLGEEQGVLVADRGVESWGKSLHRVHDAEQRGPLLEALDRWCQKEFSPEKSRAPFSRLVQMLSPEPVDVEKRLSRVLWHPGVREILFPAPEPPPSLWERLWTPRRKRRSFLKNY